MMLPEISETYRFRLEDFDEGGRNKTNGETFREVVKNYERDFHTRHDSEYATNLYANSQTMRLLERSCEADSHLTYGMDLTQGFFFDPTKDPEINHEIDKASKYILVYGIDSAYMTDFDEYGYPIIKEDSGIWPLTLLIDNTMKDGTLRLSVPTSSDDDGDIPVLVNIPQFEYV